MEIIDQMEDELEGAEKYVKCALKWREKDRNMSAAYKQMAEGELNHYSSLYEWSMKLEPGMNHDEVTILKYLRGRQASKVAEIKAILASI